VAGAPDHDETDNILDMFAAQAEEAGVPEKDITIMFKNVFEQAEKISEPLSSEFISTEDGDDAPIALQILLWQNM